MYKEDAMPCDGLVDYIVGHGSDVERKRFERHLAACAACREEAAALREVWDRLADDMPSVEPPADLKQQVLDPLLRPANDKAASRPDITRHRRRRMLSWVAFVAALMMFFFAGWLSADLRAEPVKPTNEGVAVSADPSSIETLYQLTAERGTGKFEGRERPYGVACLVRSGEEAQFVVYVFDSPATIGSEAYQVWLWNEGQRRSAGTFTVDDSGIGMMTFRLVGELETVDAINVTLEPDGASSVPRGPTLFDSEVY